MIRHRERVVHSPAAASHGDLMASAQAMISKMDIEPRAPGYKGVRHLF